MQADNMKLCLIVPVPPPYGGVANWEQILEKELKKHKEIKCSVINIAANKRPLDGRTMADRIFYSGYVMLRAYIGLWKRICNERPEVVHMTTSGGLGFIRDLMLLHLLKRKGVYSVYHVHFGRAVDYKRKNDVNWKKLKKAVGLADTTIVIDHPTYGILCNFANDIQEINNPIDVQEIDKFRGNSEERIILYIGWIIKAKGVEELIEAFCRFNVRQSLKYRLYLVGPGEQEYVASLSTRNSEYVVFTGEVAHSDAMRILSKAESLVLPSYTEGFPNVILEAMAMEKCIIATRVGAIPDMLSNDSGILIEPKSIEQIVEAFEMISDEKIRKRIAQNAYRRVVELYDIKTTFSRYKKIWEKGVIRGK